MTDIRLIAFDLDGTLLTEKKELTPRTRDILEYAAEKGIELLATTGRALSGIPDAVKALPQGKLRADLKRSGRIISAKRLRLRACRLKKAMDKNKTIALMNELMELEVMPDPFIDVKCYMVAEKAYLVDLMDVTDSMKDYIRSSRTLIDDMIGFLADKRGPKDHHQLCLRRVRTPDRP